MLEQDSHLEGSLSSELTPLLFQEGFSIDHDGNLIATWHVDFRTADKRSPIGAVIKYCHQKFAIERSHTVKLAKPAYYRQEGETLIYDQGEGLVTKETVVQREIPVTALDRATEQSLDADINRAVKLSGQEGHSISTNLKGRTVTNTNRNSLDWGKDLWLFCTAMEPPSEDESRALLESLDPEYDHQSHITSPRTLAQMLARAYVERYGPPHDTLEPVEHTINRVFAGKTHHRPMLVIHGPVVYVDDPYAMCASALASQDQLVRTLLPIFVKARDYSGQREYRFVIPDKTYHKADCKIMPATPELLAAIGRQGDSKGPMVVPEFDTTGVESVAPAETTGSPQLPSPPAPLLTKAEMTELNSASPTIPEHHKVGNGDRPPSDFQETVGVYPAVATLHEKIDHSLMGVAATQPERKPYVTSAAWYAERSIRKLCHRFGEPIEGISIVGDDSIVIDIRLPHWRDTECKLAVMPSGAYAMTLKRKSGRTVTNHFSSPIGGAHGMATSLDEDTMDSIASFESPTSTMH